MSRVAASIGAEVDLALGVDDDGDDDDDGLDVTQPRGIGPGRRAQAAAPTRAAGTRSMSACSSPCGDSPPLMASTMRWIDVDAEHVVAARGVLHRQRQADVAEPDDRDPHASTSLSAAPAITSPVTADSTMLARKEQGDHRVARVDRRRAAIAHGPGELAQLDRQRLLAADRRGRSPRPR